jgi:hypothetical protein
MRYRLICGSKVVELQTRIDWPEFDRYLANNQRLMSRIDQLLARAKDIAWPPA